MIDTSAEALLKLAGSLREQSTKGPRLTIEAEVFSTVAVFFETIAAEKKAPAAERAAAAPDVVERVARALTRQQINHHRRRDHRQPTDEAIAESVEANWHWQASEAAAALSALRPGDEVPAGVVVPREPTREMQRAYFDEIDRNMKRVQTDLRFGRHENNALAYRAMLSAIKGDEHE